MVLLTWRTLTYVKLIGQVLQILTIGTVVLLVVLLVLIAVLQSRNGLKHCIVFTVVTLVSATAFTARSIQMRQELQWLNLISSETNPLMLAV